MASVWTNLRQLINPKSLITLGVGAVLAEVFVGRAPTFSVLLMVVTALTFAYSVWIGSRREFQKKELLYRTAIEGTHLGMWEWDVARRRGTSHRNWGARLGYDDAEGYDGEWDALVHPEDMNALVLAIERHSKGATPFANCEFRMKGVGGEWFWVMGTGQAVDHDDDGRPRKLVGVHMDISETKRAQSEAVRKREQLAAFVEYAPAAVAMFDADMRYVACTRQWFPVVGVRDEDVAGRSYFEVSPSSSNQWRDVHRSCLGGNIERCDEDRMVRADGSVMRVRWEARPWNREDGTIGGVCVFFEDISETRALIDELAATRDRALKAARAKSQFLASMSHEIRTPMNAILGMAELLGESELESEQREYLRQLESAGEHLLALINEILDLSKIEAGQLKLERTRFNIEDLVDSVGELMSVRASGKGIDLLCRVDPGVPVDRMGDPVRVKQILINLMGNAIKFTDSGEVVVRVSLEQDSGEGERLVIAVRDTGIGISPEHQRAIFESFTQADTSTTRKYGGTGLGLSISKRLATMMDGTIAVESELGKGSTFRVTFKLDVASEQQARLEEADLGGSGILIVDPNEAGRNILAEDLERWGARVTAVEAMDAVATDPGAFDLALVAADRGDGGFAAVGEFRERSKGRVPVLLLTRDTRKFDESEFHRLHVVRALRKPIARRNLARAVAEVLASAQGDSRLRVVGPARVARESRPLKILVAEDQKVNQLLIQAFLKSSPHELTLAGNGRAAVDLYVDSCTERPFDIVFMDVQMPVMDGYAATAAIRDFERRNGLDSRPVIALTANAMREDVEKSLAAGCQEHLSKPIKKDKFLRTIEKYARQMNPMQRAS